MVSEKGETPKKAKRTRSGSENSDQRRALPTPMRNEIHKKRKDSVDSKTAKESGASREEMLEVNMAITTPQPRLATPIREAVEKTKTPNALESTTGESPGKNRPKSVPGYMSPRPLGTHRRSSPLLGQFSMIKQCLSSGKKLIGSHSHPSLSPVLEETTSSLTTHPAPTDISDTSADHPSGITPSHSRSVRFGPLLSPEEFDKRLPPNTPVKVGKTPTGRRRSSPGIVSHPQGSQLKRLVSEAKIKKRTPSPLSNEIDKKGGNLSDDSDSSMSIEATDATMYTPTDELHPLPVSPRKRMITPVRKAIENGVQLKATRKKMATPVHKQIESGAQLQATPKRMGTPMRQAIEKGTQLQQLRKRMATPIRQQIESGTQLRATRKRMGTPMRHAIEKGTQLQQLRKRMTTPIRQQIESGTQLRATRKRMGTPMRHDIEKGTQLRQLRKRMATPMHQEIESGIQLNATKKRMATPLRHAIEGGTRLRQLRKKMTTPVRQEIEQGIDLKKTKKQMATPMKRAIQQGIKLKSLRKKMMTPLRKEIEDGTQLRKTKKRMATPMKQAIQQGIKLKSLRKKMMTPLRKEIKDGTQLRKTKKRMATPMKQAIQQGIKLKEKPRRKMVTPLRNEIKKGLTLRSAASKKVAPIQRVKLMETLPKMDVTMNGLEIMKSESHQAKEKKQADIHSRVKLTAVRRLKPSQQLVKQSVFHFLAKPASVPDDTMMSPAPKRSRKTQPKEIMSTPLDGLKRLVKTPKTKHSTSVPEDTFESGMFATPRVTCSEVSSSRTPGIQRLMKTPRSKRTHEDLDQSPCLDGIRHLVRTPQYVLKPVHQSPALDGISRLLKTPSTKQPSQAIDHHFNPNLLKTPKTRSKVIATFQSQLSTGPKMRNDLLSPEKYFNTHLFDMVKADEDMDMTGFVDIFQSPPALPPAVSLPISLPPRQISTRTRKRTAHVKLEDEQPVKRQHKATAKEETESVEVAVTMTRLRRRKATMTAAPVVVDLTTTETTEEDKKAPATRAMTRSRRKTIRIQQLPTPNQEEIDDSVTGARKSRKQQSTPQTKVTENVELVQPSPVSTRSKYKRVVAKDPKQLTRKTVKIDKEVEIEEIDASPDWRPKMKTRCDRRAPSSSTKISTRPTTRSRARSQAACLLK